MDEKKIKLIAGHRKRVKSRFKNASIRSLADYELLEILLFYAIPRVDTKDLAKRLLNKFGSLKAIVSVNLEDLLKVEGVGESSQMLFKILGDFFSRLYIPVEHKEYKVLSHWNDVISYCQLTMGYKDSEYFRILFLNSKNMLIEDHLSAQGTVDRIHVYPRESVKKALECNATALILVHNHPAGDPTPSKEDITFTKNIIKTLEQFEISMHDHIIIARGKSLSFKAENLI